ncbi:21843_t:CDS:1, partial [Gigaspora rosea]
QALERLDHEAFVEELHIENITAEMELEYERERHEKVIKELDQQKMEWEKTLRSLIKRGRKEEKKRK